MRQAILDPIRRAAGTTALRADVARVSQRLDGFAPLSRMAAQADFPLQGWWERSYWEPSVALAIRDHVRPGDVGFDVGANAGAFAMMMSRQVGPRGIVCAFEASPRIVGRTQHNLVQAGCTNVTLYHRAVWNRTGDLVAIAEGSHLNDRVEQGGSGALVPTLALDDFVDATGLLPAFIKMDIEGAEFDALRGMPKLLAGARPGLVLEQSPEDMRCHALLAEAGYAAMDLATYRRIDSAADFPAGTGIANVLFLPRDRAEASPYFDPRQDVVAHLAPDRFLRGTEGVTMPEPLDLPPGRYILRADFTASGTANEVFAGVESGGEAILRYHTYTQLMAASYRDWVVQLDRPMAVAPYLRFISGADPSLDWRGVEVLRLPAFDSVPPPVVF
jgi:FkbM family methyltransferase